MSRSAVKLNEQENQIFHINYNYMWQKLNTGPYYVVGSGTCPRWIRGAELLPSYVNLSKCKNNDFVPSMNLVNKIVQFYNHNIEPEITAFQFIKEDLSQNDTARHSNTSLFDNRFEGFYYGYYYSDSEGKHLNGAMLKIYNDRQSLRATLITGIKTQKELYGDTLKKLISKEYVGNTAYEHYKHSLDISEQKLTLYEGNVLLTDILLFLQLQGVDKKNKNMGITFRIDRNSDDKYWCGLSLATLIGENFDVQMFKVAVARAYEPSLIPLSFDNPHIDKVLSFEKGENEHITLNPQTEKSWYEVVVENGK